MSHWSDKLVALGACSNAVAWVLAQPSPRAAWCDCERGDWMLWLLGKLSGPPESASRKKLVLAACACARLALPHVRPGEDRPRIAIETAERLARGENDVRLAQVKKSAADAVANSAAHAVGYFAHAAAYVAYSASVYLAYAAGAAAGYAAAAAPAARTKTLAQCANIVRQFYPQRPRLP